jgi:hypothetical protein
MIPFGAGFFGAKIQKAVGATFVKTLTRNAGRMADLPGKIQFFISRSIQNRGDGKYRHWRRPLASRCIV